MSHSRPDSPIERPDGSLVCKAHGLVVCGYCTVDYSFMKEVLDNGDEEPQLSGGEEEDEFEAYVVDGLPNNVFGYHEEPGHIPPDVSNIFPQKYQPPTPESTPDSLFIHGVVKDVGQYGPAGTKAIRAKHHLLVDRSGAKDFLIYTDGACLNNGQANPKAGWAFVWVSLNSTGSSVSKVSYGTASFRLENAGPKGDPQPQTSNRAELRAVIAALQFRVWAGAGWKRCIIATDSEYVVNGATSWIKTWPGKGWVTAKKEPVKNRDLWELLLKEVRKQAERGLEVLFWGIPRGLNTEADAAAKKAAEEEDVPKFTKYMGIMSTPDEMAILRQEYKEPE